MNQPVKQFENLFFYNQLNRFVGSGGEIIVKGDKNSESSPTKMEIGDILIGVGLTHYVENMSQAPGIETFRPLMASHSDHVKMALRAFMIKEIHRTDEGFVFNFNPLTPSLYSKTLEKVSGGKIKISPNNIPEGTIILSFIDPEPEYQLSSIKGSPGENWYVVTKGTRHWAVGIGKEDDFWSARFPFDDVDFLTKIPPSKTVGTIKFGLSLLNSSGLESSKFHPVTATRFSGRTSRHQFHLTGAAAGTMGLDTPFPIGLRTEILFNPIS